MQLIDQLGLEHAALDQFEPPVSEQVLDVFAGCRC